jgi:cell division septum initiation protein DivIVA
LEQENNDLRERIERLEKALGSGDGQKGSAK